MELRARALLLLLLQGWYIEHSQGFNVGTSGAKIFSGPSIEEFGYTVQQFSNHQGQWLLVGAPWKGYDQKPQNRKGDVYKCAIAGPTTTCEKLSLQNSINIPNVQNINVNMSLGLTLMRSTKTSGFMTCGPLWAQSCGNQYFYPGVCAEVSPLFAPQPAFSPALQTCGGPMDIVIVLDGSNSIYPWPPVVSFLKKLLGHLEIGPQQSQVSVIQYGVTPQMEFKLNTYKNRSTIVMAAADIPQRGGTETNTFQAIEYARANAFLPSNGGRPGASKVMVVVTDGESHDNSKRNQVIPACEKDGITRFGIAVLGYYIRNNIDSKKLVEEIKSIASIPSDKFYFNVSAEDALLEIAGTLGDRIFNIEGTGTGGEFQMEFSQVGFSAHQTKNQDVMMLGAVGAYGWTGTVVHKNAQNSEIFPKEAFERILEDKNHSSLLGYSVTTLYKGSVEYFVAGAPRSNHSGQVVVYTLDRRRQPEIRHSQRGDQIGSYFGSVLCPLDVDGDGVTDLLLVGAPMYMSEQKKEMGKVYIFKITDGFLSSQGFLEGSSPLENARFGMAIASAPDLNLDGFSDVVVGAPLEEDGQGAIYIYNGDGKTIRKQSSQKILSMKLDPKLRYFGRSLDASGDLNGDSIPDVSVGAYGKVLQLWSRGVAVVTAQVTFSPDRISILSKPCSLSGRMVYCFKAKVCFNAEFKPSNPVGPAEIKYNLTLDADLQSSRVSSRGHFGTSDRVLQRDISVTTDETCHEHQVYVQDTPDLVNSIAVRVDIALQQPDSSPVLDAFSPTAWEFFIPFSKDCGADGVCYSDLVLSVQREPPTSPPLLVSFNKKKLTMSVTVMNRKENAYNTRVIARYSSNLFYSSVTPPRDGTEVKCTSSKDTEVVTCQVGYPALRTDQSVTFEISFEIHFNVAQLQKEVKVVFEAQSDSTEETPGDNSETEIVAIQYATEIILSRVANLNVYLLDEKDEITNPIKNYKDIGPEFNFDLKVSGAVYPASLVYLNVMLPISTKSGNQLLYITSVKASPPSDIQCETQALIDPFKIEEREYKAQFTEESFRGTEQLNCNSAVCKKMQCVLNDLKTKTDYIISVSTRIWNGTFAKADFQSVVLVVNADIKTSQPDLLLIAHKHVTVDLTVSKPGAKGDVPVGVIVGSVIGGLLLLALAVLALWKFGFFKRKYQQLPGGDGGAEAEGLQDSAGQP
ncbi:integrin alpha-2 [Clarias gariepinus]|uniref:integrin alpha-2 n=1 Tax=Clarias gariepinus TaxID=13013 RepID=UPI00234D84C2|nr:integrin alpha-2 [Clarias gariepinus]